LAIAAVSREIPHHTLRRHHGWQQIVVPGAMVTRPESAGYRNFIDISRRAVVGTRVAICRVDNNQMNAGAFIGPQTNTEMNP
jgi:hypothetical protein